MISRYVIVESTSIDRLVLEVNALLHLGWIPQGGAAKNETHYIQAMIKLEKHEAVVNTHHSTNY
jgi:hypothetical protein